MPEYLSPGVYVEEVASGPRPIEGVSTSTAGFVGLTERGPTAVRMVTSWPDFTRWFGSTIDSNISYLPFSARGFFENGGQRLFIGRVVGTGALAASDQIVTSSNNDLLNVMSSGPGVWGNNIMLRIQAATKADLALTPPRDWFRITLLYFRDGIPAPFVDPLSTAPADLTNPARVEPTAIEDYDNLTFEAGRSNNMISVISSASQLIQFGSPANPALRWEDANTAGQAGNPARPTDRVFAQLAITGGDGALVAQDYLNALNDLANVDEISILAAPDEVRAAGATVNLTGDMINQCEQLRDRFALFSVAQGSANVGNIPAPRDTTYGGIYYPWLRVFDPRTQEDTLVPPVGHIAGIFARSDVNRGVHKAPANEGVRGLFFGDPQGQRQPLEFRISKQQHDILNPQGINVIRDFRQDGRGIRVWGARTMSSDSQWRYINVRRLFLFIGESIDEGTQWVVFEPNHEPTWAGVRRAVTNFLLSVWRSGGLQGVTQDEAFFVKCDRTTMTQADVDSGHLICEIGIAPVKPAEFVIFRIGQKTVEAE